jgi:hypothetical protein
MDCSVSASISHFQAPVENCTNEACQAYYLRSALAGIWCRHFLAIILRAASVVAPESTTGRHERCRPARRQSHSRWVSTQGLLPRCPCNAANLDRRRGSVSQ